MAQEDIAALKKQYGELVTTVVDGKTHAFRMPTLDEFEDYQEKIRKADRPGPVFRELAQMACVTDLDALQAAFRRRPMLPTKIHDALIELMGSELQVVAEKD